MNPFFYRSSNYEAAVLLPNSGNCKIVDVLCHVKVGAGNCFLLLFDTAFPAATATMAVDHDGANPSHYGLTSMTTWPTDWVDGVKVRVAPGEGSLCPELAENTNYYVFRDGVYLMLATTQANALAHVPIPLSAGTGVSMDLHVFDWLEFPPMPIADGTTTGPSWDALMGREFKDGIYLVLSTVDTGVTSPGAVGFFDAAYTR